jgi:putative transposase
MTLYPGLIVGLLRRALRSRQDLLIEHLVLRQQLAVCMRQPRRRSLRREDRLFWAFMAKVWPPWRSHLQLVQPGTVIRWHRSAWRCYWTWRSRRRGPGRPRISGEVRALIVRIARENPRWGAMRIVGELRALGFTVSARTVRRYRRRALRRPPSQPWQTFLTNHAPHIWAVDLFAVQTLTFRTLYAIVFIAHDRRRIVHVNVTSHPTAAWVWRQVIEATPWGLSPRHLIRDRDRCYGADFVEKAARLGIHTVLSPVRAPNANAVAERVIGTLRRECLDQLIVLGERHLLGVLREYTDHYNRTRPHRTLALDSPLGRPPQSMPTGRLVRRKVLGGLHSEYEWAA